MKRNFFGKASIMFITAMLMISVGSVNGQALEYNDTKPYMEVYDANDNLVKSYSDEEIKKLMEEAKEMELSIEPEVNASTPYAHIYNADGHLVKSTVKNAVETQQFAIAELAAASSSTYNYGATSFSSNISLSGGKYFNNPADVTINPKMKFEGLLIKLYKEGYTSPSGSIKVGNFSGGIHVPLKGLWNGTGKHRVQFNNANTNGATINLNAGTLFYN